MSLCDKKEAFLTKNVLTLTKKIEVSVMKKDPFPAKNVLTLTRNKISVMKKDSFPAKNRAGL